jgi:hypothetical protein
MRREVATFSLGLIIAGAVTHEPHHPYLPTPDHNHIEIPEGTIRGYSIAGRQDSGAATSTASTTGTLDRAIPYRPRH